jgi:hypothetical protein
LSPAEARSRLTVAQRELTLAAELGHTREVAAWRIAVEVLGHLSRRRDRQKSA